MKKYEFEYRSWQKPLELINVLGVSLVEVKHKGGVGIITIGVENKQSKTEIDRLRTNLENDSNPYATPSPEKPLAEIVASLVKEVELLKSQNSKE